MNSELDAFDLYKYKLKGNACLGYISSIADQRSRVQQTTADREGAEA